MLVIPVFLFGTRGDILPIVRIVTELLKNDWAPYKIIVITHDCFVVDISQLHSGLEVRGVNVPPIATDLNDTVSTFHAPEYVSVFERSLLAEDVLVCVICNLFSLKSVHLAFSRGITCILLHPNKPPAHYCMKKELLDEFATLQPVLHYHCQQNCATTGLGRELLHHADYENWLWPTLVHEFDESKITHCTRLLGPVVLILNSPRLSDPLPVHPRYHLCGAVSCEAQGEALRLEVTDVGSHNGDTTVPSDGNSAIGVAASVDHTEAAVAWLAGQEGAVRLCVDFGSMMPVLASDHRLSSLLGALCAVSTPIACVVVCHGYASVIEQSLTGLRREKTVLADFVLVKHAVDHSILLPKCTALLHHGGIGTTNACMRAGIPQLVAPVMYDQAANGRRVEHLKLGLCVDFDNIFPLAAVPSADASPGGCLPAGCLAGAYQKQGTVERLLLEVTTPVQRLRCACVGRDVRADHAEDGLANAVRIVKAVLYEALTGAAQRLSPPLVDSAAGAPMKVSQQNDACEASAVDKSEGQEEEEVAIDREQGAIVFANGLRAYAHVRTAPEETVFLYEEIFLRAAYGAFVESLCDGDLVVDAGANVGLFALYAAGVHLATNSAATRKQLRLVAIEPIPDNADLLCRNLALLEVDAVVYRCALSGAPVPPTSASDGSEAACEVPWHRIGGEESDWPAVPLITTRTQDMCYYPHIPGNSCSAASAVRNAAVQDRHMSRAEHYRGGARTISSPALSLSQVLAHYFAMVSLPETSGSRVGSKRCRAVRTEDPCPAAAAVVAVSKGGPGVRRIALLKVDVEGDELELLRGISPEHWRLIDRVVVEARSDLRTDITDLLTARGYQCDAVEDARTGNWLVFAQR